MSQQPHGTAPPRLVGRGGGGGGSRSAEVRGYLRSEVEVRGHLRSEARGGAQGSGVRGRLPREIENTYFQCVMVHGAKFFFSSFCTQEGSGRSDWTAEVTD